MAPPDASAIELRCPHCKITGTAYVVEPPEASDPPVGVAIAWVPDAFRVGQIGRDAASTEFTCAHCGEIAG